MTNLQINSHKINQHQISKISCPFRSIFIFKFLAAIRRILKCDAGEGWRSAGPIVWETKSHKESRRR